MKIWRCPQLSKGVLFGCSSGSAGKLDGDPCWTRPLSVQTRMAHAYVVMCSVFTLMRLQFIFVRQRRYSSYHGNKCVSTTGFLKQLLH